MKSRCRSPIAIDFGEHRVRVLQLEQRGARLHVRAAREERVADERDVPDRKQRLAAACKRALRGRVFRGGKAAVALRLADVATRHVRLPVDQAERANEIIARQVQEQDDSGQALSICPIPVADLFDQGERKREFLCCVAGADRIAELIAIVEAAGLVPVSIDLAPCAQVRAFVRQAPGEAFVLLDIGSHDSRITVVHGGTPVLMRATAVGGDHLRAVVEQTLELDVASLVDLDALPAAERAEVHDAVTTALASSLEPLLQLVAEGMRYCGTLFRGGAIAALRVAGSAAHLPGLVDHVAGRLGVRGELADPFAGIHTGTALDGAGSRRTAGRTQWSTALGLALGGLP